MDIWHEGGWFGLQRCCSIGDKLLIRWGIVGMGHVDLIFGEEGGIVGDEQVPER